MNSLIHADCLSIEGMQSIDDKSIDMILADLPYGTTACKWDVIIPFDALWTAYKRIIKDNGAIVLTASQPFTSQLVMSNLEMFKYEWIWEKSKASNFLNAKKLPLKAHENIPIFYKNMPTYNPQKTQGESFNKGVRKHKNGKVTESYGKITNPNYEVENKDGLRYPRSVLYFRTAESEGNIHPTQKPVALFEYLIKTYTNEGNLVLDNAAGSMTTAIACINLKRSYICIEKDADIFDRGKARVTERLNQ